MSAIIGTAYATGENVVTSKSYVDNTFQTKIPVNSITGHARTDFNVPNALVVSPTLTPGEVGEIGIMDAAYKTAASAAGLIGLMSASPGLIPTTDVIAGELQGKQAKKVCAGWPDSVAVADRTDENCWLWQLPD